MEESADWANLPASRSIARRLLARTTGKPHAQRGTLECALAPRIHAVTKQIPSYLKLVTDTSREASSVAAEDLAALAGVAQAFEQATGWRLELEAANQRPQNSSLMWSAPVNPGVGKALGHIRLISGAADAAADNSGMPLAQAALVADAVGALWGELVATRQALCQREAELAAGVPVVLREDEHAPRLSERLEAVLRGGAQAIGCDAVALYLLDPATTELKLRASWGLPKRPAYPARPAVARSAGRS